MVSYHHVQSGPIQESKGICVIFQKRAKKRKRAKKGKMCKSWKYFEKGQPHACDYHTHETARICPDNIKEINDPILRKLSERRADG